MDSGGNIYADPALKRQFEEETGARVRKMRSPDRMPRSAIKIESPVVAASLAQLNRAARLAFYGARRNGASELVALARAEATIRGGR